MPTGSLIRSIDQLDGRVEAFWFADDDPVPNSADLPVLLFRAVPLGDPSDRAAAFEDQFQESGWPPQWRNGIYDFHHYHSTAHEALGIARGTARVLLGGPHGSAVDIASGDCLFLPAGTGHCLINGSRDLLVVGAYPPKQDWDLRRDRLSTAERAAMASLQVPDRAPVSSCEPAYTQLWARFISSGRTPTA